jgi:curved DNA-binding protein CbpA
MRGRPRAEQDHHATLGVAPGASEEEIRRAYRRLALRWHPDRNPGDPGAAERFRAISEAYAVLIDPVRRRAWEAAHRGEAGPGARPSREDVFRDLFADARASAIFEELARELAAHGVRVGRHDFQRTLFGGRGVVVSGVFVVTPLGAFPGLLRAAGGLLRAGRPARQAPARPASRELPRRPGVLDGLLAGAKRWLGLSAGPAPPGRPAGDLELPLRLTAAEARDGARKRVSLPPGGPARELLVRVPANTRPGTRLRLRGQGPRTPAGGHGDVYLTVALAD